MPVATGTPCSIANCICHKNGLTIASAAARVGIPDERAFATKPALAQQMLERALRGGRRDGVGDGDSVYGDDASLRRGWSSARRPMCWRSRAKRPSGSSTRNARSRHFWLSCPVEGWERLSAGAGSKGARLYDWLRLEVSAPQQEGWKRSLLVRRSISDPRELTGYIAFARATTPWRRWYGWPERAGQSRKHSERQRRGRLGSLRSALVDGVVSTYDLGDVGASVFEYHTGRK